MFEFLFKRQGDKPGEAPAGQEAQPAAPAPAAPQRALEAERLGQVNGDEAAAVEFILQSDFSELRLAAAEFVHSPSQLERVHAAMRNHDRRVAKLMQSRLDAIRHHQAEQRRAEEAIARGRALLADELLTPNHVADLDRTWSVIDAPQLQAGYDEVRAALGRRLEAQVTLQRAMIDRVAALRQLETRGLAAAELARQLGQAAEEQAAALAAPEHASLPRTLAAEFAAEHARLSGSLAALEQGQAALAAREAALSGWQGQPTESLDAAALRKEWGKLPALPGGEPGAQLQARFDALLAALPQPVRKPRVAAPAAAPMSAAASVPDNAPATTPDTTPDTAPDAGPASAAATKAATVPDNAAAAAPGTAPSPAPGKRRGAGQQFLDTLDALEAALQQGSLGTAAELDKHLKDAKGEGTRLTHAQSERLAHVRAEFKRLSDWARWGGNVSREELIKSVEQLPAQQLAMSELAKKVGSMRERWKALDSVSGAAPRSLWERFDAACSAAYAPAAAHFRHLADERHANAARGQALLEEARGEAARMEAGEADWKHLASTVNRLRQAWSHLGAIDRKEKKRLDQQFADVLNTLQAPLARQREGEVGRREELIEEVGRIDAHGRHALDTLRELQHRWQEYARALPLERKAEQALWQRFRAACDELFARRKESAHAADAERRAHEAAKEAISARLEAAAPGVTAAGAGKLLREAAAEWHAAGPVPRAHEARVEKRYHAAVALVQHHADLARRAAGQALANAVRDKLRVVQELEAVVAGAGAAGTGDWQARFDALPAPDASYEQALRARLDAALAAMSSNRAAYASLLEQNRSRLLQDILRLEIAAGIDSGAEFARERLKLQVEVLQSQLKSGQKPGSHAGELRQLVALPALADARTVSRIEHLLVRLAREGK